MATVTAKTVATSSLSSMLTEAETALPYIEKIAAGVPAVISKFPDIVSQGGKLVSGLAKLVADAKALNPTAAIQDGHNLIAAGVALYADIGLPQGIVSAIAKASPTLPSVTGLEAAFSDVGKMFGI